MERPTDLRFVRTEQRIRQEFFYLMEEVGFQKITVRMLVEHAEINRSTFYLHYTDKFDLLERVEEELFAELKRKVLPLPTGQLLANGDLVTTTMLSVAEYIYENGQLFMLLAGEKGDPYFFRKYGDSMRSVLFTNELIHHFTVPQKYVFAALAGMMSSLFSEWLGNGLRESPEVYVSIVSQIVKELPATALAASSRSHP